MANQDPWPALDRRRWIQVAGGLLLAPAVRAAPAASAPLDRVFVRFDTVSPEYENGFVQHQTMAAEALDRLGLGPEAGRFSLDAGLLPLKPGRPVDDWRRCLGDWDRFVGWTDFFEGEVGRLGWRRALGTWAGRLASGVGAHLYHGVIRTSHAAAALTRRETAARRRELVNGLSYWAARSGSGLSSIAVLPPGSDSPLADPQRVASAWAISAALTYEHRPNFLHLHAVTGSMAAHRLLPWMAADAQGRLASALARSLRALGVPEPAELFAGPAVAPPIVPIEAIRGLRDPHAIKLFDAADRGARTIGHLVFGRLMRGAK